MKQQGESFVLTGKQLQKTAYPLLVKGSVRVYALAGDHGEDIVYEENVDYVVDYERGAIARTENSRIPDFRENVLFGKKRFNHGLYSNYGNAKFTVYADYKTRETDDIFKYLPKPQKLKKSISKLKKDKKLRITVFGDSISTGCEASVGRAYFDLLKAYLEEKYGAEVSVTNCAVGGDCTVDGMRRFSSVQRDCDLAIVAFGVNDANQTENGKFQCVNAQWYGENLGHFILRFQDYGADVICIAPFAPNPDWIHASKYFNEHPCAAKRAALSRGAACVDMNEAFSVLLQRGKPVESLLRNNINHPNNFGHYLYFKRLKEYF